MFGVRRNLVKKLKASKKFREAYVRQTIWQGISHQIREMREARNMTQGDLAEATGKSQSNIARLEDPDYGKYTLKTLMEVADAFDVWLTVDFVSFSEGLRRSADKSVNKLNATPFEDDTVAAGQWVGLDPTRPTQNISVTNDLNTDWEIKVFPSVSSTPSKLQNINFVPTAAHRSIQ